MEVTECSETSVTVRIANDTDKDIRCGSDFSLEMQDEETGAWWEPGRYRIVKTITDFRGTGDYTNYVFTAEFGI